MKNTIRNLPVDERNEIDHDLQRHNYFINLGEKNDFSDHNITNTFCDFFSTTWKISRLSRFDRSSKTNKVISKNQLYEEFSSTDAWVLASIQALAALNMYSSGSSEISRQALTEFLHNMSHQALNKDNYNIFIQFDRQLN